MDIIDITIIGAGITGLAIAAEVSRKDRDVILLEKHDTFGKEQSSRSSEVIHAGIYARPEDLSTQLCIEGNRLIYGICDATGIPCLKCGKIFMAADADDADNLEGLYYNGINNGLPLKKLSQRELHAIEPNINAYHAFYSPTSGVMDSHTLMRYFLLKSKEKEARAAFRHEVTGIEKIPEGYRLFLQTPEGEDCLDTRVVINCAGLFSDRIAEMAGIPVDEAGYRLFMTKGEFYGVGGGWNRMINCLVYPPPEPLGPSIHICFDVEKRLRIGPHFYYTDEIDYRIDDSLRETFEKSAIVRAFPFIRPEDLEPESTGIMGSLHGNGEQGQGFVIRHEEDRGLPGFINCIGIGSPGLTAAPAIGKYVARMVGEVVG
ncbi:MAG: NAD(P)/FAD-dependent oxidoreductase [Dehalococcoidales bacterium]|nr:NAD(P)/FAD-dependent oxidoreductase [Dehalococcoidales bacterium]